MAVVHVSDFGLAADSSLEGDLAGLPSLPAATVEGTDKFPSAFHFFPSNNRRRKKTNYELKKKEN